MTTTSMQFGQSTIDVVLNEGQMPAKLTTTPSGGVAIILPDGTYRYPILGSVGIYHATVDGNPASANQAISSQVLSASMNGEQVLFSEELFNDFGTAAFDPAQPGKIYTPPGASQVWVSASLTFPAEATGTGVRWARVLRSQPFLSHFGNFGKNNNGTVIPTACQVQTGWVDTTPGEYFYLAGIQDSGASISIAAGTIPNGGAGSYLKAMFR